MFGGLFVLDFTKFLFSKKCKPSSPAIAVAWPPPMHRLATPRFMPYLRSAPMSVTRLRAPEAPIGWPSAQAPPCTFTLSCGRPGSFIAAIATTAQASLISSRATVFAFRPFGSNGLERERRGLPGEPAFLVRFLCTLQRCDREFVLRLP